MTERSARGVLLLGAVLLAASPAAALLDLQATASADLALSGAASDIQAAVGATQVATPAAHVPLQAQAYADAGAILPALPAFCDEASKAVPGLPYAAAGADATGAIGPVAGTANTAADAGVADLYGATRPVAQACGTVQDALHGATAAGVDADAYAALDESAALDASAAAPGFTAEAAADAEAQADAGVLTQIGDAVAGLFGKIKAWF